MHISSWRHSPLAYTSFPAWIQWLWVGCWSCTQQNRVACGTGHPLKVILEQWDWSRLLLGYCISQTIWSCESEVRVVLLTWGLRSVHQSTLSSVPRLLSRSFIQERNNLVSIHGIFTRYGVWWPGIKAPVVRVVLQCKRSISAFTLKRESTVV